VRKKLTNLQQTQRAPVAESLVSSAVRSVSWSWIRMADTLKA